MILEIVSEEKHRHVVVLFEGCFLFFCERGSIREKLSPLLRSELGAINRESA